MLQRINWRPDRSTVRYFAVTLAVLAVVFALLLLWLRGTAVAAWAGSAGIALAAGSYLWFPLGRLVYVLWMAVSYLLGLIVSPIILGIIYYLVLTPLGLYARLRGKDELRLRRRPDCRTYFSDVNDPMDPESFRRQF